METFAQFLNSGVVAGIAIIGAIVSAAVFYGFLKAKLAELIKNDSKAEERSELMETRLIERIENTGLRLENSITDINNKLEDHIKESDEFREIVAKHDERWERHSELHGHRKEEIDRRLDWTERRINGGGKS